MKQEICNLFNQIEQAVTQRKKSDLPSNTYFLDQNTILCLPRQKGDSRYPYGNDGFYLWAYQSGYICANQSAFTLFPFVDDGKQPYVAFFVGVKQPNGSYFPFSMTGVSPQPRESVSRYTVFTPACTYYLCKTDCIRTALRVAVNKNNGLEFTLYAQNLTSDTQDIYFSSYFNPLMRYMPIEDVESKWYKQSKVIDDGFLLKSVNDLSREHHVTFNAVHKRYCQNATKISTVTAHTDFTGSKRLPLNCSNALFDGEFSHSTDRCSFTDVAISADIVQYSLRPYADICQCVSFDVTSNQQEAVELQSKIPSLQQFDATVSDILQQQTQKQQSLDMLKVEFCNFDNGINDSVFNNFVANVIRQVESCALAKVSSVSMLGVRDVFQQIESALIWNAPACRAKILEALNFLGVDGRAPRQYSLPANKKQIPLLDLRAFIDQGVWIIDALYTYLAYTGDISILSEQCGYYIYNGNKALLTHEKGSVLQHLLRIVDYLINNIDEKTGCLKILYGDWNDALDGLGTTSDKSKEFGNGVSVMATLQLCKNLVEMTEILQKYAPDEQLCQKYSQIYQQLKCGLQTHAVCQDEFGNKKILHGWGENKSYLVGSFDDVDGQSRDSASANAYWVLGGAYQWDKSIKKDILNAYRRLDSKYGIKTFQPYFQVGTKGVGRIPNLPKGTAENGATYIHATMFAIWSLFNMDEPRFAWEQTCKVLPITHQYISTSPFVMPNSYVLNEEFAMDGQSMNDWYTGSATVLIKVLIRCMFGINLTQNLLKIAPTNYFPCQKASISLRIRNCAVTVTYHSSSEGKRHVVANGVEQTEDYCVPLDSLPNSLNVDVFD